MPYNIIFNVQMQCFVACRGGATPAAAGKQRRNGPMKFVIANGGGVLINQPGFAATEGPRT
ncbi:protein of unknown function [Rhodovastum atsumiense]|nr:protein of unknown function [Rhodovastum atsumiense]